uniref:Uncharacterized protein n=1 Tax=Octopus bimaculoides TaxID=37653 RepID=A0A0L8G500_OCTBM
MLLDDCFTAPNRLLLPSGKLNTNREIFLTLVKSRERKREREGRILESFSGM